jgi:hypothetical protein
MYRGAMARKTPKKIITMDSENPSKMPQITHILSEKWPKMVDFAQKT